MYLIPLLFFFFFFFYKKVIIIFHFFIAANKFYIFDSDTDKVQRGMTISDYFGPRNDSSEAIPGNLDSVFFDISSQQLQFFKGEWVSSETHTHTLYTCVDLNTELGT